MNLVFLVNILYQGIFRDNFDGMTRIQDFANPFLYLNGVGFLFHLFFDFAYSVFLMFSDSYFLVS